MSAVEVILNSNGWADSIGHCYCDTYVKIDMVCLPFTSLHKKIMSTKSSPPEPPSTCSSMQVGTGMC
jgi:hypothetical protein